jgi:hypothetical protein
MNAPTLVQEKKTFAIRGARFEVYNPGVEIAQTVC